MTQGTRREGVLIQPYKQLRFGITFLCLNLLFSVLIVAIFGYFLSDMYRAQAVYFKLDAEQADQILYKLATPMLFGIGLTVLFILSTLIASARYTHQFYGPMVSIQRFLDQMRSGVRPEPIHLRQADQMQELASSLNAISERMPPQANVDAITNFLDEILAGRHPQPLSLDADSPLHEIAERLNRLREKA